MENQFQRLVNISYLAVAALVAFLSLLLMMKVSATYDLESKVKAIELVVRGLSVFLGGAVFFGLYSNAKANLFMNEVVAELMTKVTWPTSKETFSATGVVIVTVVIAGFVLAFFDWIFTVGLQGFWSVAQRVFS